MIRPFLFGTILYIGLSCMNQTQVVFNRGYPHLVHASENYGCLTRCCLNSLLKLKY